MSEKLTDEAKEILLEVAKRIEATPQKFDMGSWYEEGECGTTACIAGWIALIQVERGNLSHILFNDMDEMGYYAGDVIGVPIAIRQGLPEHPLFFLEDWHSDFWARYVNAWNEQEAASVAAQYIREFVAAQ